MSRDVSSIIAAVRGRDHDTEAFRFLLDGDVDGVAATLTFRALGTRIRALAAVMTRDGLAGRRAVMLYPPGLEFIVAFLACLDAGVIAVPAFPPDPQRLERTLPRLRAIAADAEASAVLTTSANAPLVTAMRAAVPELLAAHVCATDAIDASEEHGYAPAAIASGDVAFLQYTSGSTSSPRGVRITHGNLLHNAREIQRLGSHTRDSVIVTWLPGYHDMGLIGGLLQGPFVGASVVAMAPTAFLRRPARWLEAITRHRGTSSPFPNFALDLCVRKVSDAEHGALDLTSWAVAWNGAEPIRSASLERFAARFGPRGFSPRAFLPVYGLAEGTLIASGGCTAGAGTPGDQRALPELRSLSRAGLAAGIRRAPANAADTKVLVGCGESLRDQRIAIVDPETAGERSSAQTGEIWLRSPSVGAGYWNRPAESERVFGARLAGTGEGPFLRTGDLGFLDGGQLFITGRLKDVIVIRGANLYPQDVEELVEVAHPAIRAGSTAAVAIDDGDEEGLAVVAEVSGELSRAALAAVAGAIREALAGAMAVTPRRVALIGAGALPKTSSGKVQRHACRSALEAGTLATLHVDGSPPRGRDEPSAPDDTVYAAVVAVLARVSGHPAARIGPDVAVVSFLGLDSILVVSASTALEEIFGPLGDDLFGNVQVTVAELVATVTRRASRVPLSPSPPQGAVAAAAGALGIGDFEEATEVRSTLMLFDALEIENPFFRSIEGGAEATVRVDGRELVNFGTYNYLGLASDARVKAAAIGAIERYGTSASASRVASGERPVHRALELALAAFLGCEDALVFASGHATNIAAVATLVGRDDLVLHDVLAHDSIVAGARLSGARRLPFPHNDLGALERTLATVRGGARRVLIAVEGAYSMDGDVAPLAELVALKRRHDVLLMVDEAHSLGCVGATGRGIGELAGVAREDVDVWMGTLSKTLASCGGYLAGSQRMIELLKYRAGGFVYAAAITPANAAAALEALRIVAAEPHRVTLVQHRAARLLALFRARGVDTGRSRDTAIIPAIVGGSVRALRVADELHRAGISAPPIIHPAVDEDAARLRFFVSALHSEGQLEQAADALARALARVPARAPRLAHHAPRAPAELAPQAAAADRAIRRVLVTGGSGFIGSRTVARLASRGIEVRCLLRPTSNRMRLAGVAYTPCIGDLDDVASLAAAAAGCDALVHLACVSAWSDIRAAGDRIYDVAVRGTQNVLAAAERAGVARVVHVSSVAAINGSEEPRVFDEDSPYEIEHRELRYSLAKRRAEACVQAACARGLDAVIVCPAEVYGPGDDALVTAGTLLDILNAKPAVACDGGTSIAHVDDVAAGIVAALLRGRTGERYILGGDNLSVLDLTLLLLRLAGRRENVVDLPSAATIRLCRAMAAAGLDPPIPLDVLDYATLFWFVDSGKARRELGYAPRSANDTLRATLDWLRATGRLAA